MSLPVRTLGRDVVRSPIRSPLERGNGGAWSPAVLGSRLLYWNDPSDLNVTWQDSARTTAAVVDSPVGSRQSKGSLAFFMQQATAGSRYMLRLSGGFYYDETDGLDDSAQSSAALNLAPYGALTVCTGLLKESDAAVAVAQEFSPVVNTNDGSFNFFAPQAVAANLAVGLRGTTAFAARATSPATQTSPYAAVATQFLDPSQATTALQIGLRLNGVAPGMVDLAGPTSNANFGSYTLNEGRRNNTSLPFTGRLYQRVIVAGILTGTELTLLERFVGAKQGIVL